MVNHRGVVKELTSDKRESAARELKYQLIDTEVRSPDWIINPGMNIRG